VHSYFLLFLVKELEYMWRDCKIIQEQSFLQILATKLFFVEKTNESKQKMYFAKQVICLASK